jgi:hypothetical protein
MYEQRERERERERDKERNWTTILNYKFLSNIAIKLSKFRHSKCLAQLQGMIVVNHTFIIKL